MSYGDCGSSSGTGTGAGVESVSLNLVAHAVAGVGDLRYRKSCCLVSRVFVCAKAVSCHASRVVRRKALPRVLRAFPALALLELEELPEQWCR